MKASLKLQEMFASNPVPGATGYSLYTAPLDDPQGNMMMALRSCVFVKVDARCASHFCLSGLATSGLGIVAGPLGVGPSELFELPL
jgi:hypothetical protein